MTNTTPLEEHFDVAIVGLGPVGSAAAILLADAGLKVVAVERDEEVYRLPRAVNLDGEIIRAFQPSGRAEKIDSLMQTVRDGERAGFANGDRQWMFGQSMIRFGLNGWQPLNMFDQPELEGYLREQAVHDLLVTAPELLQKQRDIVLWRLGHPSTISEGRPDRQGISPATGVFPGVASADQIATTRDGKPTRRTGRLRRGSRANEDP